LSRAMHETIILSIYISILGCNPAPMHGLCVGCSMHSVQAGSHTSGILALNLLLFQGAKKAIVFERC
jgi:hypothetical protein